MKQLRDFGVSETRVGSQLTLTLVGAISESARMEVPTLRGGESTLEIDLEGVGMINSAGIRRLVMWLTELDRRLPQVALRLVRVLPPISRQLVVLKSHLPQRMAIASLFIVYFCENCDVEDDSTLVNETQVNSSGELIARLEPVPCSSCGKRMVYDDDCARLLTLLAGSPQV